MPRTAAFTGACLVATLVWAGVGLGGAGATAPPDDDTDSVVEFVEFAATEGYDLLDPVCTETEGVATCYSLVLGGGVLVATRSTAGEWILLGAPDGVPDGEAPGDVERAMDDAMQVVVPEFDPVEFFTNLFSGAEGLAREAIEMTNPGSPAAAYARYQLHFIGSSAADGRTVRPAEAEADGDTVSLCLSDTRCVTIDDLSVVDERIDSFSVEGEPIADRLGRPGNGVVAGPVEAKLVTAYAPVTSDRLTAYVQLADSQGAQVDLASAVYRGADGTVTPVDRAASPRAVDAPVPRAIAVALTFPDAVPGGEIRFVVEPTEGSTPLAVVIPVLPFGGHDDDWDGDGDPDG